LKRIFLTKGYFTLIDNEDFDYLSQWKWHIDSKGYAVRTINDRKYSLARQILKLPKDDKLEVDHINRVRLDNRKINLRIVTRSENLLNRGIQKNNNSGFKGVSWSKTANKWRTTFKGVHLGYFISKEKAIKTYYFVLGGD
jgi:hypothetical protein